MKIVKSPSNIKLKTPSTVTRKRSIMYGVSRPKIKHTENLSNKQSGTGLDEYVLDLMKLK